MFSDGLANIKESEINYDELQKQIKEFHEKYYSANISSLVIISNLSHGKIAKYVKKSFSKYKDKKVSRPFKDNKERQPVLPFLPD